MRMNIGRLAVRRSVFIHAPPERVWEEFASYERVNMWLGLGHRLLAYVPEVGAVADFSVSIDGRERHFGGEVLVFEPGHELSLANNWQSADMAWPVPMLWTFRLTAMYDGTLVEFFHHGFERLGEQAADELAAYESSWTSRHLLALRAEVEDAERPG